MQQEIVNRYLDAVEQALGSTARQATVIEHRGGNRFFFRRHDCELGRLVSVGEIRLMARYLRGE